MILKYKSHDGTIVAILNNHRSDCGAHSKNRKSEAGKKCIKWSQPTRLMGKEEDSLNALFTASV
jgi:hypothetical protein